ncbi:hypothetical protein T11_5301 [Trichinella zimbabwensis]|uniref:Secreted protein n=1 Tax=Trichinella zimbabwensis TaxID=268475 RepID=A0A0V1HJN0_9BILA|nr:hypothetical protein T11_5301 [Trichinella zimbabwensis]
MSNTSTLLTSVVLVAAAGRPMVQLATTVTSRLLISVRLSEHFAFTSSVSEHYIGSDEPRKVACTRLILNRWAP